MDMFVHILFAELMKNSVERQTLQMMFRKDRIHFFTLHFYIDHNYAV